MLCLLIKFGCQITAISPEKLGIPREIVAKIPGAADAIRIEPDLRSALPHLDVLYMTRVQKERFHDIDDYASFKDIYRLTCADLKNVPAHLRILHPLPRVNEIAPDVDRDPRAHYFTQSLNGVPVRMALLSAILGFQSALRFFHPPGCECSKCRGPRL